MIKAQDRSTPATIAATLLQIARVTMGELQNLTVYGGADAGWVAAFVDWVLGLKITITSSDSQVLYTNTEIERAQVTIVMTDKPSSEGLITEATIHMTDRAKFIKVSPLTHIRPVSGRLNWDTALDSVFPQPYNRLLQIPATSGECDGSAARVFTGFVRGEVEETQTHLVQGSNYSDAAHV